jgi:hypothetical protein
MNDLSFTIRPGLYFSAAAVVDMNWCGMTDAEVERDVQAVIDDASWSTMREMATVSNAYLAGVLRMAADLTDDCVFYVDHKAEV